MQLGQFLQVGIVTDNVERAVKEMEKFGFTDWVVQPFEPRFIPGMKDKGQVSDLKFNGAMWKKDGIEIELIEPNGESVFMDYLREHGPGVHHLAFKPVGGYDAFMEDFKAQGYDTIMEVSRNEDGKDIPCFAYLDTFKQLGFYSEIHYGEPGDPSKCK